MERKKKEGFGFFVGGESEERERINHKELGKDIDRIRFRQRRRRRRRRRKPPRKKKALARIADIYTNKLSRTVKVVNGGGGRGCESSKELGYVCIHM